MNKNNAVNVKNLDFEKMNGLIPTIVQDHKTKKILTLAYVNREALEETMQTGYAHFFRRTFGKVMKKGVTSGNTQLVKKILVDCDRDAIIYMVEASGPACHLGNESCFIDELQQF
jgi:phosphoribosyl-AMP cyclohydrolase